MGVSIVDVEPLLCTEANIPRIQNPQRPMSAFSMLVEVRYSPSCRHTFSFAVASAHVLVIMDATTRA